MLFFANIQKWNEPLFELLQFGGIFFVCIGQLFESAGTIDEITRIYTHFIYGVGGGIGSFRVEVDIGDQRCRIASGN